MPMLGDQEHRQTSKDWVLKGTAFQKALTTSCPFIALLILVSQLKPSQKALLARTQPQGTAHSLSSLVNPFFQGNRSFFKHISHLVPQDQVEASCGKTAEWPGS